MQKAFPIVILCFKCSRYPFSNSSMIYLQKVKPFVCLNIFYAFDVLKHLANLHMLSTRSVESSGLVVILTYTEDGYHLNDDSW